MVFILAPSTVLNKAVFELRHIPRKVFERSFLWPRGTVTRKVFWRFVFEHQLARYLIALLPFPGLLLAFPEAALAIGQAPLAMFAAVYFVETKVLAISNKDKREALISDADMARGLDALAARGRKVLTRLAAEHGLEDAELHLVVEQSELARIAPITVVSVQIEGDDARFLDVEAGQQAMMAETLFDEAFSERDLQLINQRAQVFLREVVFEARKVSAHARLAAMARG